MDLGYLSKNMIFITGVDLNDSDSPAELCEQLLCNSKLREKLLSRAQSTPTNGTNTVFLHHPLLLIPLWITPGISNEDFVQYLNQCLTQERKNQSQTAGPSE